MEEEFDILKAVSEVMESAGPLPGGLPACEKEDCPLMLHKPTAFMGWLKTYVDLNPDLVIGLAYPDRGPISRFLRWVMSEEVNPLIATVSKDFIVICKVEQTDPELGEVIGSGGSAVDNVAGNAQGVLIHPLPTWAMDYMRALRQRFSVGERITAAAALESLEGTISTEN